MKKSIFLPLFLLLAGLVGFAQPVTINPPSATIEPGGSVTLTASGATYYQWSPATGLSTTEGPITVASPAVTTTYTCSGLGPGAESVVNGDFNQGNVGFTSAYEYNTNLWGEGTYYVDTDASLHHTNFVGLGHGGSGNFMIVNGATVPNTNVWTEQITVVPNQYYAFSTWVCTLAGQANEVALLQFSINGNQIGEVFSAPPYTNHWEQFYELWYSGNSTSATITILNQNTVGSGNDFGLDDISFCQLVVLGEPQCTVTVNNMTASVTADDTELCQGASTTLHALPAGGSGNYSFSWTPANTLDNPNAQHPVATPSVGSTTYTCHIVDNSLGAAQDVSVTLTVYPTYDETVITEAICYGETFEFYGTSYSHTFQTSFTDHTNHGCDSIVRLDLTVYPPNDTTIVDPSICVGQTYNFHGELYNHDGDIAYFDTIDLHGCLKVEKLVLSVSEYQMPPIQYQYECYPHDGSPSYYWDKSGLTYTEDANDSVILPDPDGGCDIKYRLNLRFHREFYQEESHFACEKYYWPVIGEWLYETNHHIERHFEHQVAPGFVCDSVFVLDLTINDEEVLEPKTLGGCDSVPVTWFGQDTVFYEDTEYRFIGETEDGCHREQTFHIEGMEYTPAPQIRCTDPYVDAPHHPITATEFNVNRYNFAASDPKSDATWVADSCEWSISKESWRVIPSADNRSCTLYPMDWVEDTVWLTFKAVNPCSREGVIARYWLKPSFYGIEEQGINQVSMEVVPNPNRGQMTLHLEGFSGKVDLKVYDMTGNLVDQLEIEGTEGQALPYDLQGRASGVYYFVATGREGTVTKKVIIK